MSETALPDETPTARSSSTLDEGQRQARIREGLTMALYIGLSLLAKGLIGPVIICGIIGLYLLLRREWPRKAFLFSLIQKKKRYGVQIVTAKIDRQGG